MDDGTAVIVAARGTVAGGLVRAVSRVRSGRARAPGPDDEVVACEGVHVAGRSGATTAPTASTSAPFGIRGRLRGPTAVALAAVLPVGG